MSENEQFAEKRRFEDNCEIISQGERLFGGLLNVTVDSSSGFPFWEESKNFCFLAERHMALEKPYCLGFKQVSFSYNN